MKNVISYIKNVISYIDERESEFNRHYDIADMLFSRVNGEAKDDGINIEIRQINTLESGLIVHLYNIVEAVCTRILDTVSESIITEKPTSWTDEVLYEWVRGEFWSADERMGDGALKHLKNIIKTLMSGDQIKKFRIKGTPGSWNQDAIEKVAKQIGCNLNIPEPIQFRVSENKYQDETNALEYLANQRNKIAHGRTTFEDGVDLTLPELRELAERVIPYLKAVAASYSTYLENKDYLKAKKAA